MRHALTLQLLQHACLFFFASAVRLRAADPDNASLLLQARLIKAALRDALAALKRLRPQAMCCAFEQRMRCLGAAASALAAMAVRGSPELRACACSAMSCDVSDLAENVQARSPVVKVSVIHEI